MAKYDKPLRLDMTFGEALRRFAQTVPAELRNFEKKVKREQKETDKYVANLEENIQRGTAKRPRKRFRP